MNSKKLFAEIKAKITLKETAEEINSMVFLVLQHVFHLSPTDVHSEKPVSVADLKKLDNILYEINDGKPVQYILGEAGFFGRSFIVNPHVLIPRPETEELVSLGMEYLRTTIQEKNKPVQILDVGTGSGCIPITLSLAFPTASIVATDVDDNALAVARQNAVCHSAQVTFLHHDILNEEIPEGPFDLVISNPPYIPLEEKIRMKPNVLNYEPATALFVADDDPLLFYTVIASKAFHRLAPGGMLAVEINERFGKETVKVFEDHAFRSVKLHKDVSGKDRVVTGIKTLP